MRPLNFIVEWCFHKVCCQCAFSLHINGSAAFACISGRHENFCRIFAGLPKLNNKKYRINGTIVTSGERIKLKWRDSLFYFYRFYLTCILPIIPQESMRDATLTVLLQISYCGFWAPITPAMTGPWFNPMRKRKRWKLSRFIWSSTDIKAIANSTTTVTLCSSVRRSSYKLKIAHFVRVCFSHGWEIDSEQAMLCVCKANWISFSLYRCQWFYFYYWKRFCVALIAWLHLVWMY